MIFAPGTLESAPQTHIAAIEAPVAAEDAVEKAATDTFPNIRNPRPRYPAAAANLARASVRRHRNRQRSQFGRRPVLSAAVAANRRRQQYDAVVFKVLGRRVDVFWGISDEYGVFARPQLWSGPLSGNGGGPSSLLMKMSGIPAENRRHHSFGMPFYRLERRVCRDLAGVREKTAPHLRISELPPYTLIVTIW